MPATPRRASEKRARRRRARGKGDALAVLEGDFGAAAEIFAGSESERMRRCRLYGGEQLDRARSARRGRGRARQGARLLPLGRGDAVPPAWRGAPRPHGLMAAPRRERKVVTVLFCDLVGFTSRAESLDPRTSRRSSAPTTRASAASSSATAARSRSSSAMRSWRSSARPSHTRTIRSERYVPRSRFATSRRGGARAAHRDHDRRGARLARRGPAAGEGMASGDVVNTAARLQSAAPVNGVPRDETTFRATRP